MLFDPGRIRCVLWDQVQQHLTRPPLMSTTKAPGVLSFRGSITRPLTWLSPLRSVGCPSTTQDTLLAAGPALLGEIGTRRVSANGFRVRFSFQSLPDARTLLLGTRNSGAPRFTFRVLHDVPLNSCPRFHALTSRPAAVFWNHEAVRSEDSLHQ